MSQFDPKVPIIIFDIDGTIADNRHRLHWILRAPKHKDWDSYDAEWEGDSYIPPMGELCKTLINDPSYQVILLTGRNVRGRANTIRWLERHGIKLNNPDELIMRGERDYRDAGTMKLEYLQKRGITPDMVMTLFDDNNHVVRALRDAGYHVCHVADDFTTAVHEGGPGQFDDEEDSDV